MEEKTTETVKKGNVKALLPIGVFLVLYLGLGILLSLIHILNAQFRVSTRFHPTDSASPSSTARPLPSLSNSLATSPLMKRSTCSSGRG